MNVFATANSYRKYLAVWQSKKHSLVLFCPPRWETNSAGGLLHFVEFSLSFVCRLVRWRRRRWLRRRCGLICILSATRPLAFYLVNSSSSINLIKTVAGATYRYWAAARLALIAIWCSNRNARLISCLPKNWIKNANHALSYSTRKG